MDEGGLITGVTTESERPSEGKTAASVEKQLLLWTLAEKVATQLSTDEKDQFYHLLFEYADIFANLNDDLGHTDKLKHKIDTRDSPPIRQPVRRLPPHRREEVRELLQEIR